MTQNKHLLWAGLLAFLWMGLLLGVSFLATPVKFLAPSLSLPVALDVGRQTFLVFSRVEMFLALIMTLAALFSGARLPRYLAFALFALVLLQIFWLLPVLDERVALIIQGGEPEPSNLHAVYIGIEAVKLALLIAIAIAALSRKGAEK